MHFIAASFIIGVLGAAAASAQPADETKQSTVQIERRYTETVAPPPVARSGGLVGAIENVTRQIEASGQGGEQGAKFTAPLTPKLLRLPSGAFEVTVEVGAHQIAIDDKIKTEDKRALMTEVRRTLAALKEWKKSLTPVEAKTLETKGALDVPLDQPFANMKMLQGGPVVLALAYQGTAALGPVEIRFVRQLEGMETFAALDRIEPGERFWIEVKAANDNRPSRPLEVAWKSGRLAATATRKETGVFLAGPFVVPHTALDKVVPAEPAPATSGPSAGQTAPQR